MRKIKLAGLTLAAFLLVACNNNEPAPAPEEPSVESVEEVQSESAEESSAETTSRESQSDESQSESDDKETTADESVTDGVKLTLHEHGTEKGSFTAEIEEGMSVLELMEQLQEKEELSFNFDEVEGIIDTINDTTNDYDTGETWVYLYNGQMAELGVVSQKLKKGDTIDWYYGTIDELPTIIIPAEDAVVADEDAEEEDEALAEEAEEEVAE